MTRSRNIAHRKAGLLSATAIYLFLLNFSFAHPQDGPHIDLRWRIGESSVKMRVGMNLLLADSIILPSREQLGSISDGELEELCESLQTKISKENLVLANGTPLKAQPIVCLANQPDKTLLPLFPESGMRGLQMLTLGFEYPFTHKTPENKIAFRWKHYPPDILSTPENPRFIVIQAELDDPSKIMKRFVLKQEEPEFIWHRNQKNEDEPLVVPSIVKSETVTWHPLRWPFMFTGIIFLIASYFYTSDMTNKKAFLILSVFFVSTSIAMLNGFLANSLAPTTISHAKKIFEPLHHNIYRAFRKDSEDAIYNALSDYTEGALLNRLYREILEQLTMYDEGGAVSQIEKITPTNIKLIEHGITKNNKGESTPGFRIQYGWNAEGIVFHWGHSHQRTNAYLAEYTLLVSNNKWKIADVKILDQERVDMQEKKPLEL